MLRWTLPAASSAITAATLLTACGGGGNAAPVPTVRPSPKALFQVATNLSGAQLGSVRVGPGNTIWFTDGGAKTGGVKTIDYMAAEPNSPVNMINTTQDVTSQYETPVDLSAYDSVNQAFWFTEYSSSGGSDLASIVGSQATEQWNFQDATRSIIVSPAATVSAGTVWVDVASSVVGRSEIFKYVPSTTLSQGAGTSVPVTHDETRRFSFDKTGNLWMSERSNSDLVQIDQTTGAPTSIVVNLRVSNAPTQPTDIALGPDGKLWVADYDGYIYRVDPVSGASTAFPISSGCGATSITSDAPRNRLWFADNRCNAIGKITTSGQVTEYASTVTGGKPDSIAVDADGNVWYSDQGKNQIVRMTPP